MWPVSVCSAAATHHQLGTLKWLRSQKAPCPWDASTCTAAARAGHLGVLQWSRRQQPPCPWDESTCAAAASEGRTDILEWLMSQKPPCPWDQTSCAAAIHKGFMRTLTCLYKQGPRKPCRQGRPWTQALEDSADAHITTPLEWLQSQLPEVPASDTPVPEGQQQLALSAAAPAGLAVILQNQHRLYFVPPASGSASSASHAPGTPALEAYLKELRERLSSCNASKVMSAAVSSARLVEHLHQLLSSNPACLLLFDAYELAAAAGKVEVLHWLQKISEDSHVDTQAWQFLFVLAAAYSGALHSRDEVMQWAVTHEAGAVPYVIGQSALSRQPEVICFLHSRGFVMSQRLPSAADTSTCPMLVWALQVPAAMGDVSALGALEDILEAEPPSMKRSVFESAFQMVLKVFTLLAGHPMAFWDPEGVYQQYWWGAPSRPDYMATAAWLLERLYCIENQAGWQHLSRSSPGSLLFVYMRAHAPECYSGRVAWAPETHSLAAAHAQLPVVKWLVAQQGLPRSYTTLHPKCPDARMLMLVHSHGWHVPENLKGRLDAVERRRAAFYASYHRLGPRQASLCEPSYESIRRAACQAGIDFSWKFSPPGTPLCCSSLILSRKWSQSGIRAPIFTHLARPSSAYRRPQLQQHAAVDAVFMQCCA